MKTKFLANDKGGMEHLVARDEVKEPCQELKSLGHKKEV